MKELVTAGILTYTINRQKLAIKFKRGKKSEVIKRDASLLTSYPGVSKTGIAKLRGFSVSQAVKLKGAAVKAGYLKAVKHEQVLLKLDKPDYHLRGQLNDMFPKLKDKMFFRRNTQTRKIEVYLQLCDEIKPRIILKKYGGVYKGIRTLAPCVRMGGVLSMAA
jgi:hypothetical protein